MSVRPVPKPGPSGSKPGMSRLPQLSGGIPRPASRLRRSISAPDVRENPAQRVPPQSSLLRKAVVASATSRITQPSASAASKITQPSSLASRKRPAPAPSTCGPDKKKPLVQANTKTKTAPKADPKPPVGSSTAPGKPKLSQWDTKGRLDRANEKVSKLTIEIADLRNTAAEALTVKENLESSLKECERLKLELVNSNAKFEAAKESEQVLRGKVETLSQELSCSNNQCDNLKSELEMAKLELVNLNAKFDSAKECEQVLRGKVETLSHELSSSKNQCDNLKSELEMFKTEARIQDQIRVDAILAEQQTKRILLNQILDLKGNIRVFIRVRPPLAHEANKPLVNMNFPDEASLEIIAPEKGSNKDKKTSFSYDKVFGSSSSQFDIYQELSALVQSALDGHNVCIFAYGQTGSGKTYTMQGGSDSETAGMVPRAVSTIFEHIKSLKDLGWEFNVSCSFLEIYNEVIRDLLNPNSNLPHDIKMVDPNSEEVYVSNLKVEKVASEDDLLKLLQNSHKNRFTAATLMNEYSSRSHSITQIRLEGSNGSKNIKCQGMLNLIDLAGSERYQSENLADRKVETVNINRSLTTLSLVVLKLAEKGEHIPFRDSKLTYLLMTSLKGNSKTLMMVNVSPLEECLNETVKSLKFAHRVSDVILRSKRQIRSATLTSVAKCGKQK